MQFSIGIFFGKSSQNGPILVLIFRGSIPCVFLCVRLLKVVSHYDLSVLSMSVRGFQKKFGKRVGGSGHSGERYPVFNLIFGICLTLLHKAPT